MREMIFNFYILAGRRLRGGSGGANLLSWRNFSGCGLFRDFGLFGGRGDQNWAMYFFFWVWIVSKFRESWWIQTTIQEFKDGFPDQGPFRFRVGETVHARVLDVNPSARTGFFWLFEPGGLDLDFCFLESHGNLVSRTEDHGEPDPFGEHGDTGALFTDFSIFLHFTHHSTTFRQDLEMVN